MTGRDLILHILENKLEDKELNDIKYALFEPPYYTALRIGVGVETIKAWCDLGLMDCLYFDGKLLVIKNANDPRKVDKK